MTDKYILVDGEPKQEPDLHKWAMWFETADRQIAFTLGADYQVSTVFLGVDHNFSNTGPPVLFETMVFDYQSSHDHDMQRYVTLDEARVGHDAMGAKWLSAESTTNDTIEHEGK